MAATRVVIVGAGMAGLTAAIVLAARGLDVTVVEKEAAPGGKMRALGPHLIDSGPTVLTMRWVLEEVFAAAGSCLSDHVRLTRAEVLARHAWADGGRLDLFADVGLSADAIGAFAGTAEAEGYRRFCADSARMFRTLDLPYMRARRPSLPGLVAASFPSGLGDMLATRPFSTLWGALGDYFRDPRLRQLFGRYATYCGSSPFQAPATLMLVAHAEQAGVWLVEGGMHRLAQALRELAERAGARFLFGQAVSGVPVAGGHAAGVELADGTRLPADAVVVNADVAALAAGRFGPGLTGAVDAPAPRQRSLSAVTWSMRARTTGFPLLRHSVFFSGDYRAEFDDIGKHRRLPREPTVYVCAQDRGAILDGPAPDGPERLLVLVNAPADGDRKPLSPDEIAAGADRAFGLLARCGLQVERPAEEETVTDPAAFEALFPASGGALYGRASHGWRASFQRPGMRTRLPGLYVAGGSAHPGPGVPMAALSGLGAAACLLADLPSRP